MEQLLFCIAVWVVVFLIIPMARVRALFTAAIIALLWMIFVDNISSALGYYSYYKSLVSIGNAPLFLNIAEGGIGILMLHFLKQNPISKLISISIVSVLFVFIHHLFILSGSFAYNSFDAGLDFIHHFAALSVFVLLSLSIMGEHKILQTY